LFTLIAREIVGLGAFYQRAIGFHLYFLDKRQRAHYFERWKGKLNFLLLPLFIFFAVLGCVIYFALLTLFIFICSSLNHAVQQNISIALFYNNGNDGEVRILAFCR